MLIQCERYFGVIRAVQAKVPLLLALVLYILIYLLRLQQVGGFQERNFRQTGNAGLFVALRQDLDRTISQFLPSPQAGLLSGILLGNKKDLPGPLKLALRDSSTLHIVVVSGQNLTFVAGLFLFTLAGILKRRVAILVSLGAIIFYTLLTGAQVPVIRAAIMATLAFGAEIFGRVSDGVWILIVAAGSMLLYNPNWLTDLSFQLSFLATLGVIAIAPLLESKLKFLPSVLSQDLAVTTGAQLMVLPVIAQNFHQFSVVGVLANLLVGWTIPFIMILGTVMIILGPIFSVLGRLIAFATTALLTYFIYIVSFFSSLPFAWEYVGEKGWMVWAGYYLLVAGGLLALSKTSK